LRLRLYPCSLLYSICMLVCLFSSPLKLLFLLTFFVRSFVTSRFVWFSGLAL
jgi:hypothetical protein